MEMGDITAKFLEMAKKIGVSPETVASIEKDLSSNKPAAVVAVKVTKVKPEDTIKKVSGCCDYSDEEIDKMSESEAKACIKKCRDACKSEEEGESECESENSGKELTDASKKEVSMQDIFNKIG